MTTRDGEGLQEVLDHAFFGPDDLSLSTIFGNYPIQTIIHPEPLAPGLMGVATHCRPILVNGLRRSKRNRPPQSPPTATAPVSLRAGDAPLSEGSDAPGTVSPIVSSSSGSEASSDSGWDTSFQPMPATAVHYQNPETST